MQGRTPQSMEVERRGVVDAQQAFVGPLQADEAAQQGRFSRSAGPQEAEDLPFSDIEVDPIQHSLPAERLFQPGYPNHAASSRWYARLRRSSMRRCRCVAAVMMSQYISIAAAYPSK